MRSPAFSLELEPCPHPIFLKKIFGVPAVSMEIHQLAREFFGTTSGGTTAQRLSEKRCTAQHSIAQHRFAGVRCDKDRKVFRLGELESVERGIFPGS